MSGMFRLDDDHVTNMWMWTGWAMFASLIVVTPAALVDQRTLWDVSVWVKPIKFSFSLMLHYFTLAILAQQMPRRSRTKWGMLLVAWASVAAAAIEHVYLNFQAARGRHSHFNFDTTFEQAMYALMGLGALLMILAAVYLGAKLALQRDGNKSGYRLGSVIGLTVGPLMTVVMAGYMSMSGSHWVGEATSDAGGVPLFGWSREVGDLRPAHFVSLHMMQALPLVGLIADRFASVLARIAVLATGALMAVLSVLLFIQALAGHPIF